MYWIIGLLLVGGAFASFSQCAYAATAVTIKSGDNANTLKINPDGSIDVNTTVQASTVPAQYAAPTSTYTYVEVSTAIRAIDPLPAAITLGANSIGGSWYIFTRGGNGVVKYSWNTLPVDIFQSNPDGDTIPPFRAVGSSITVNSLDAGTTIYIRLRGGQ